MKKKTALSLFSIILLVSLVCSVFSGIFLSVLGNDSNGNSNPNNWPMFLHDPGHSGYTSSVGPMTNHTLWSFQTGSTNVKSSPAVVNGIVYVGAEDGKLYALNSTTGDQIWTYTADAGFGDKGINSPAAQEARTRSCLCERKKRSGIPLKLFWVRVSGITTWLLKSGIRDLSESGEI